MNGNEGPRAASTIGFATVGRDVTVWPSSKIVSPHTVWVGDSVIIDDFVFINSGTRTQIGSFVHLASFTLITGGGELVLEDFVGLSGTKVYTGDEDYLGGSLTGPTVPAPYRNPIRSSVRIQKHAVIGSNSVILSGVTIGEGAAVGANSLVNQDLEPWTLYVGSPARPLRQRPREAILALEERLRQEVYDEHGDYIPRERRVHIT